MCETNNSIKIIYSTGWGTDVITVNHWRQKQPCLQKVCKTVGNLYKTGSVFNVI